MSTTVWTQDLAQLNRKIVTLSFNEMVSRAYAEALRKNGVHTRFTKDGVDDDASCSSIESFGAVLASALFLESGVCHNALTKRTI